MPFGWRWIVDFCIGAPDISDIRIFGSRYIYIYKKAPVFLLDALPFNARPRGAALAAAAELDGTYSVARPCASVQQLKPFSSTVLPALAVSPINVEAVVGWVRILGCFTV